MYPPTAQNPSAGTFRSVCAVMPPPLHSRTSMLIIPIDRYRRLFHPSRLITQHLLLNRNSTNSTLLVPSIMVISSFNALNKIEAGGMRELNDYITWRLDCSTNKADDTVKPVGLHFLIEEKIFKGTNQPFVSCPIQFRLRDRSPETKLCQPVWTEASHRSKVNKKARVGVKKHSVIRLDDFLVVPHKKALSGYIFFIRNYLVVKRDVDQDAYDRWLLE